jgi:hypothetical protein
MGWDISSLVALYAAIVSTAVFFWQIWSWGRTRRPVLNLELSADLTKKSNRPYLEVSVYNAGMSDVQVESCWLESLDRGSRKRLQLRVADEDLAEGFIPTGRSAHARVKPTEFQAFGNGVDDQFVLEVRLPSGKRFRTAPKRFDLSMDILGFVYANGKEVAASWDAFGEAINEFHTHAQLERLLNRYVSRKWIRVNRDAKGDPLGIQFLKRPSEVDSDARYSTFFAGCLADGMDENLYWRSKNAASKQKPDVPDHLAMLESQLGPLEGEGVDIQQDQFGVRRIAVSEDAPEESSGRQAVEVFERLAADGRLAVNAHISVSHDPESGLKSVDFTSDSRDLHSLLETDSAHIEITRDSRWSTVRILDAERLEATSPELHAAFLRWFSCDTLSDMIVHGHATVQTNDEHEPIGMRIARGVAIEGGIIVTPPL